MTTTENVAVPESQAKAAAAANRAIAEFEGGDTTLVAALECNGWVHAPAVVQIMQQLAAANRRVGELSGAMGELAEYVDEIRGKSHVLMPLAVTQRLDEILRENW